MVVLVTMGMQELTMSLCGELGAKPGVLTPGFMQLCKVRLKNGTTYRRGMVKTLEIKRCKYCNTEATAILIKNAYGGDFWRVECGTECSYTRGHDTKEQAIDEWNKRQGETE